MFDHTVCAKLFVGTVEILYTGKPDQSLDLRNRLESRMEEEELLQVSPRREELADDYEVLVVALSLLRWVIML